MSDNPTCLLQVLNSLFQVVLKQLVPATWYKHCEDILSTACEQTSYNLFAVLEQLVCYVRIRHSNATRLSISITCTVVCYPHKINSAQFLTFKYWSILYSICTFPLLRILFSRKHSLLEFPRGLTSFWPRPVHTVKSLPQFPLQKHHWQKFLFFRFWSVQLPKQIFSL